MKGLNLPNAITIFRILLVIPIATLLIDNEYLLASIFFLVAAASDVADGFIARTFNLKTEIGSILDPLADKILLNYTFTIFAVKGLIPRVLFVTILSKDILLVIGSAFEILSKQNISKIKIKASITGKLSTFLQVSVVVLVFFKIFDIYNNKSVFNVFVYLTIALSILALLDYFNKYKKCMEV